MRVVLGWLLLFGLAALAGWSTARWRAGAKALGESVTQVQEEGAPGVPARVLIGKYSGAEPLHNEEPDPLAAPSPVTEKLRPEVRVEPQSPVRPHPYELTVRPGSTLSKICQDFYKETGRPPLSDVVTAVAEWNGLASPNDLRAGQVLELPPLLSLFP